VRIRRLVLSDFRNFERAEIEFGPRFTVLSGQNGAGKTNVLEALWFLGTLRSFRGSGLPDLVRHGRPGARVELHAHDPALDVPTRLSVTIDRGPRSTRRTARLDDKVIRSAAQFYGHLPAVLFTPEDLSVLRGSPTGRRQFLDRVVFARDRRHLADVIAYEKLVRSRNRLLKGDGPAVSMRERDELIDTYDAGITEHGARMWERRERLIESIVEPFVRAFGQVHGPGIDPGLRYAAKLDRDDGETHLDALARGLRERRVRDLQRGVTTAGPHRDDLEVTIDGRSAGQFASQGQARALVLAFKIAELRQAAQRSGTPPLLLLDDVSSELDPQRNARLFGTLSELGGQCVLTTTAAEFIRLDDATGRVDLRVQAGTIASGSDAPGASEASAAGGSVGP
jgi:DNA replication and repair protein RecF